MLGNTHYQNKPSVLAVNRSSMRGSRYLMIEGDWNLTLIPNFPCVPSMYAVVVRLVHIQCNPITDGHVLNAYRGYADNHKSEVCKST